MREQTLARVDHPELLTLDGDTVALVSDPVAASLQKGDPALGWEGDPRLALYLDRAEGAWVLVRLESDNVYRMTMALPGSIRGIDAVAQMVVALVTHDRNRGFDALAVVESHKAREERESKARQAEFSAEAASRMSHALRKDGV